MRIDWSYGTAPVPCSFFWTRSNNTYASGTTTNTYVIDSGTSLTATATYTVQVVPTDPNNLTNGIRYVASNPATITVVPQPPLLVTDNQTVDARYDPRYSTYVYLDHNFGTSNFRGGLFSGIAPNGDNARLGRSFLRFTNLPQYANLSGGDLWPGTLNLYCIGALISNTSPGWTVGVQAVSDNGWTLTSLTWDSAPPFTPSQATITNTITYDTTHPAQTWYGWSLPTSFIDSVDQQSNLLLGLADQSEAADLAGGVYSWLYFARKEYNSSLAPCILYATGAPLRITNLVLSASSVKGGSSVTCTIYLNGPWPTCPVGIALTGQGSGVSFPGSVLVTEGASEVSFTITTSAVTAPTPVTITATLPNYFSVTSSGSVTLTVTP
jgi:hypothetical protein